MLGGPGGVFICTGISLRTLKKKKKKKKESEKAAGYMLLFGPQAGGQLGGGSSRNPDCAEELRPSAWRRVTAYPSRPLPQSRSLGEGG